jgi:hypothetical protein
MFDALIRFGLWGLALVLAAYLAGEFFPALQIGSIVDARYVETAALAGLAIVAAGVVGRLIQGAAGGRGARCRTCRRKINRGAIFCRIHLRQVIETQDELARRRAI